MKTNSVAVKAAACLVCAALFFTGSSNRSFRTLRILRVARNTQGLLGYDDSPFTDGSIAGKQNKPVDLSTYSPKKTSIQRSSVFFPSPDDLEYCLDHNEVHFGPEGGKSIALKRPFSIRPGDFIPKYGVASEAQCLTLEGALNAIKSGKRVWGDINEYDLQYAEEVLADHGKLDHIWSLEHLRSQTPEVMESALRQTLPSTFIPALCDMLALSPHDMCDISNKFGHIAFFGDSLMRHIREGFLMGLSNNIIRGTIIGDGPTADAVDGCRCDNQFSEQHNCRQMLFAKSFYDLVPYNVGLCPHIGTENQVLTQYREFMFGGHECRADDGNAKPYLLIANGGLHFQVNATYFYEDNLKKQFLQVKACVDAGRDVYILYNGMGAQSAVMDYRFAQQSIASVIKFNDELKALMEKDGIENVIFVDWVNFTKEAQTSDGVHHLAQVNYWRAQYLLRLADLALKENKKLKLPPSFGQ